MPDSRTARHRRDRIDRAIELASGLTAAGMFAYASPCPTKSCTPSPPACRPGPPVVAAGLRGVHGLTARRVK
jgi:hypothetical protein